MRALGYHRATPAVRRQMLLDRAVLHRLDLAAYRARAQHLEHQLDPVRLADELEQIVVELRWIGPQLLAEIGQAA